MRCAPSAVHGFHPYMNSQYSQIGIKSHTTHWALGRLDLQIKDTHTHTNARTNTHWKDRWETLKYPSGPCKSKKKNQNIKRRTPHPTRKAANCNRWVQWAVRMRQTGTTTIKPRAAQQTVENKRVSQQARATGVITDRNNSSLTSSLKTSKPCVAVLVLNVKCLDCC